MIWYGVAAVAMVLFATLSETRAESDLAKLLDLSGKIIAQESCSESCWNGNRHSSTACGGSVTDRRGCEYNCAENARAICDEQGCCVCQRLSECN